MTAHSSTAGCPMIAFSRSTELIHSPLRLDQVLGAVGDLDEAQRIDRSDIAGAQPAVRREALGRGLVVVAAGDPWPVHLDLAHALAVPGLLAVVADRTDIHQRQRIALHRHHRETLVLVKRSCCAVSLEMLATGEVSVMPHPWMIWIPSLRVGADHRFRNRGSAHGQAQIRGAASTCPGSSPGSAPSAARSSARPHEMVTCSLSSSGMRSSGCRCGPGNTILQPSMAAV